MKHVIAFTRIQYAHETYEQFCARAERIERHNAEVDRADRYARAPAKAYWPWCRRHAPWMLPEEER